MVEMFVLQSIHITTGRKENILTGLNVQSLGQYLKFYILLHEGVDLNTDSLQKQLEIYGSVSCGMHKYRIISRKLN